MFVYTDSLFHNAHFFFLVVSRAFYAKLIHEIERVFGDILGYSVTTMTLSCSWIAHAV